MRRARAGLGPARPPHSRASWTRWLLPLAGAVLLLYWARPVLAPFAIAAVLAYAFSPLVDWLERRTGLARLVVVSALFLVLLGLLALGGALLEARLVSELSELRRAGPDLLETALVRLLGGELQLFGQAIDSHRLAAWTSQRLTEILGRPTDALGVVLRAFDTLLKAVLTLLALFYLLLDGRRAGPFLLRFIPPDQRAPVCAIGERVHQVLGRYLRGQLFLVGLMASVTFVALEWGLRLPFALPLALATGVLEVIPVVGPITAGALASVVALGQAGPGLALAVAATYLALRLTEDQLVMPLVVGRAVDLHPLVTMFAVLLGGSLGGVLGAVLSVPIAAVLRIVLDYAYPDRLHPANAIGSAGPSASGLRADRSSPGGAPKRAARVRLAASDGAEAAARLRPLAAVASSGPLAPATPLSLPPPEAGGLGAAARSSRVARLRRPSGTGASRPGRVNGPNCVTVPRGEEHEG